MREALEHVIIPLVNYCNLPKKEKQLILDVFACVVDDIVTEQEQLEARANELEARCDALEHRVAYLERRIPYKKRTY
jgi:uncharacterized protein YceH (UPF0502 family)